MGPHTRFPRSRTLGLALVAALLAGVGAGAAHAAEYGTGPWVKGYTDIFGGIVPPQPGLYFRTDAYHYEGSVNATVFDGRIALGVEQRLSRRHPGADLCDAVEDLGRHLRRRRGAELVP